MSTPVAKEASGRRRNRTFKGCLTCRRRKVKCTDGPFPCGNCRRLDLECVSPFTQNLRPISHDLKISRSAEGVSAGSKSPDFNAPFTNLFLSPKDAHKHPQPAPVFIHTTDGFSNQPFIHCYDTSNVSNASIEAFFPANGQYLESTPSLATTNPSPPPTTSLGDMNMGLYQAMFDESAMQTVTSGHYPSSCKTHSTAGFPTHPAEAEVDSHRFTPQDLLPSSIASCTMRFSEIAPDEHFALSLHDLDSHMDQFLLQASGSVFNNAPASRNSPMPTGRRSPAGRGNSPSSVASLDGSSPTFNNFSSNMSSSMHLADGRWNVFSCLLAVAQNSPSLVKTSLVAWAGMLLPTQPEGAEETTSRHYVSASDDVIRLCASLMRQGSFASDPLARQSNSVRSLLTACFFLCQCDIMNCNMSALRQRIDSLKHLVHSSWYALTGVLTPVDYRILVWLSFLDVRISTFQAEGCEMNSGILSDLTMLDVIVAKENLTSIYLKSRSHVHGSQLDLVHELADIKFGEAMALLSNVVSFDTTRTNGNVDPTRFQDPNLMTIQVQGLRRRLLDLYEQCETAMDGFKEGETCISVAQYHWLLIKVIQSSAVVLLNRAINPDIRSDLESQKAARDILKIVLKLRDSPMSLPRPAMFCPFAIFVAGIEIDDDVYKDWILQLLDSAGDWEEHTQKAQHLLRLVMKRQEEEGRRVNIRDMVRETGLAVLL